MYRLECALQHAGIIRMLFINKRQAENARRKIAKEMGKGRFRNDVAPLEIKSDASTYSIDVTQVVSVSVNDCEAWMRHTADEVKIAKELEIPVRPED